MSYTKEPWVVRGFDRGIIETKSGEPILGAFIGEKSIEEMQANTRLAATAPKMLEALEMVANKIPMQDRYIEDMVYSAIEEARGR